MFPENEGRAYEAISPMRLYGNSVKSSQGPGEFPPDAAASADCRIAARESSLTRSSREGKVGAGDGRVSAGPADLQLSTPGTAGPHLPLQQVATSLQSIHHPARQRLTIPRPNEASFGGAGRWRLKGRTCTGGALDAGSADEGR